MYNQVSEEQKYKRGTLVKVLNGHTIWARGEAIDIAPEQIGQLAIIEYSYAEKYGGSGSSHNQYSIIFNETGSSLAWKYASELEFFDDGGEHLFSEAQVRREAIRIKENDMSHIANNLSSGKINSINIHALFDLIGYKSKSLINGEFYTLFSEWNSLESLFIWIKKADTLEKAKLPFTDQALKKYNIEKVWEAFHKPL